MALPSIQSLLPAAAAGGLGGIVPYALSALSEQYKGKNKPLYSLFFALTGAGTALATDHYAFQYTFYSMAYTLIGVAASLLFLTFILIKTHTSSKQLTLFLQFCLILSLSFTATNHFGGTEDTLILPGPSTQRITFNMNTSIHPKQYIGNGIIRIEKKLSSDIALATIECRDKDVPITLTNVDLTNRSSDNGHGNIISLQNECK